MSVKTFVELSGKTQSSGLDVLAFVDSGYTSTYQINKQTFLSSVLPIGYGDSSNGSIVNSWAGYYAYSKSQYFATLLGGTENMLMGQGYQNTILGGKRNRINSAYAQGNNNVIIGGYLNDLFHAGNGNNAIIGGFGNQTTSDIQATSIFGSQQSSVGNTSYGAGIFGGAASVLNGGGGPFVLGGYGNQVSSTNCSGIGSSRSCYITGGYEDIGSSIWGSWNSNISNNPGYLAALYNTNYSTIQNQSFYSTIMGGEYNTINNQSTASMIIESSGSTINFNLYSGIIGGKGNYMSANGAPNSNNNYIINSINCRIEEDSQYSSSGITMINCRDMDVENQEDITYIGMTGQTYVNGGFVGKNTGWGSMVIMPSTYTIGTRIFSAETYTATTIQIDPRISDHIIINTDGSSTYNISFSPIPESAVYASFTFYINYVSGSTINFVNSGGADWKWGNNLGAPVFSGTNANIIVVNTLKNNDLFEVSRSMYMS